MVEVCSLQSSFSRIYCWSCVHSLRRSRRQQRRHRHPTKPIGALGARARRRPSHPHLRPQAASALSAAWYVNFHITCSFARYFTRSPLTTAGAEGAYDSLIMSGVGVSLPKKLSVVILGDYNKQPAKFLRNDQGDSCCAFDERSKLCTFQPTGDIGSTLGEVQGLNQLQIVLCQRLRFLFPMST